MTDQYFYAVQDILQTNGIASERVDSQYDGYLGMRLYGEYRNWEVFVDCDERALTIPKLKLAKSRELLAHVSYGGSVCVNDKQGLSLDLERHHEIVAQTVLDGFKLLEQSYSDAQTGYTEFFNELEGYWGSLPKAFRGSAIFEVDTKARLLTAHVERKRAKWWLTEYQSPIPSIYRIDKSRTQRALYVHLEEVPLPPTHPEKLDTTYIESLLPRFSPTDMRLWDKLLGPSKNNAKRLVLMLSVPRESGGLSLVGIEFGARLGTLDKNSPVIPLTMRRHSDIYMRERGGAPKNLKNKHIAVIGCGSVGSFVADTLASSGIGQLTLIDSDDYSEDNVFRHLLDPFFIDYKKVFGLKIEFERKYPGVRIHPEPRTAQEWFKNTDLKGIDGIVMAIGSPSVERDFSKAFRASGIELAVVYTWLEPMDIGGHSIRTWSQGPGCLDCLYRDDEGAKSLHPRTSFIEPDQAVTDNLTGCASVFVPYGAIQARRTALLAAEDILDGISGEKTKSYRYWRGQGKLAQERGIKTTPWWKIAKTISSDNATNRVFGRPCACCRVKD
jgi:hypothetical protein